MHSKTMRLALPGLTLLLIAILACNLPGEIQFTQTPLNPAMPQSSLPVDLSPTPEPPLPATLAPAITHLMTPSSPGAGRVVYDVESQGTAPEGRAPYGDSWNINRLERPFLQDMSYISDLDIQTYTVARDDTWWYVSVKLIGSDPNNPLGINYGVELDLDHDGFGDYIIWAHPPYSAAWETFPVQIYQDKNHDTGGLSAEKSDAPLAGDGYEALIFNGGASEPDPDVAWVRLNADPQATIQFAFKRSWSGTVFMLGVLADAGLQDQTKLDYVDRFPLAQAGSPLRENQNYPLKELFAVDNACREAFGFDPNGYEPQLCPRETPPTKAPTKEPTPTPQFCLTAGTLIDTPAGLIPVEDLNPGDMVWTMDKAGRRIQVQILETSRTPTHLQHQVMHIILDDGREAWVSAGHPTADGRTFGDLEPGDLLDGAQVSLVELVPYSMPETYDLLPAGETGYYWANGILMGSTLFAP